MSDGEHESTTRVEFPRGGERGREFSRCALGRTEPRSDALSGAASSHTNAMPTTAAVGSRIEGQDLPRCKIVRG